MNEKIKWISIPDFKLINNNGMWNVFECIKYGEVIFIHNNKAITIEFPLEWKTDIASSPIWARSFLPQIGPHAPAALVHDRVLNMGLNRSLARRIMWRQLKELPLVKYRKYLMYCGVLLYDIFLLIKS